MLDIFFTNKIPSTQSEWTDELIAVASIFNEFDGLPLDYDEIVARFEVISKRLVNTRDSSDYRDEYGAYASFLGIMNFEKSSASWICRINKRAQKYLCDTIPDPEAFLRWQLALFQYPNPIGGGFQTNGTLRIEPKSLKKRTELIKKGVKTSPFRLIMRVLVSLAENFSPKEAYLTFDEIWDCLFTKDEAISTFEPNGKMLASEVAKYRHTKNNSTNSYPQKSLRNLHILGHTGVIAYERDSKSKTKKLILVREACDENTDLGKIARTIANLKTHFSVPNSAANNDEIGEWTRNSLESGSWADYYSGLEIPIDTATTILQSVTSLIDDLSPTINQTPSAPLHDFNQTRKIRSRRLTARKASIEETEVLREKANMQHRAMVALLANRLTALGITPLFNVFIDVAANMPSKKMLFEVKSCRIENLLAQVRKGVSQLYEYRYRHEEMNGAKPVLMLEQKPKDNLAWLVDYLIKDRGIALCWLEGDETLAAPAACEDCLGQIVHRIEP